MKKIADPKDIPNKPHYAVIVYDRHLTYNYGDGFAGQISSEWKDVTEHWITTNKKDLKKFIKTLNPKRYCIINIDKKINIIL